jgi:spore coat polysaccharide biosynthesis protein SpsF
MNRVIVRCDGGVAIGMGHVSRCLALADALRDEHACRVTFVMRDPASAGVGAVRACGYAVEIIDAAEDADYGPAVAAAVATLQADAIVVDVRDALSRRSLEAVRASGVRVVIVDDGTDRRLAADLAFCPPVPQVDELDWHDFGGQRFAGWEWVMLKREFSLGAGGAGGESDPSPAIDILLTMGGSDPAGMTEFAVGALEHLAMPLAVRVVIGPAFSRAEELIDVIARSKHAVRIARAPQTMASLMRASRIAVVAFGVSAYELAACGVPAVHLCLTDDHARSSSAFEKAGIALTAGVFGRVQPDRLADAVSRLMSNAGRRTEMAERARQLVDGRGASRVAALVTAGRS